MRNGDLTYDDFLQRLNIQDILIDAGYHMVQQPVAHEIDKPVRRYSCPVFREKLRVFLDEGYDVIVRTGIRRRSSILSSNTVESTSTRSMPSTVISTWRQKSAPRLNCCPQPCPCNCRCRPDAGGLVPQGRQPSPGLWSTGNRSRATRTYPGRACMYLPAVPLQRVRSRVCLPPNPGHP